MNDIPNFNTKKELFDFLVKNKETLITAKKSAMKAGDGFQFVDISVAGTLAQKALIPNSSNENEIKVIAIINTTNIVDSHKDLHINGIWNKSIKENKNILHLQEHELKFDHIIAEGGDLKVSVKVYTWKELGFNYEGSTEALVFESTVKRDVNEDMFKRYSQKKVKNHSVGMIYVKIALAINDDNYLAEKALWEKHYPIIANKSFADESGYFWAVTEAKAIEGSAVPIGSNRATPTLESKSEPLKGTQIPEPSIDTQQAKTIINELFKTVKL